MSVVPHISDIIVKYTCKATSVIQLNKFTIIKQECRTLPPPSHFFMDILFGNLCMSKVVLFFRKL